MPFTLKGWGGGWAFCFIPRNCKCSKGHHFHNLWFVCSNARLPNSDKFVLPHFPVAEIGLVWMEIIVLIYAGCAIPDQPSTRHLEPWEAQSPLDFFMSCIYTSLDFQALASFSQLLGQGWSLQLLLMVTSGLQNCYSAGLSRADPHFLKWKHTHKKRLGCNLRPNLLPDGRFWRVCLFFVFFGSGGGVCIRIVFEDAAWFFFFFFPSWPAFFKMLTTDLNS